MTKISAFKRHFGTAKTATGSALVSVMSSNVKVVGNVAQVQAYHQHTMVGGTNVVRREASRYDALPGHSFGATERVLLHSQQRLAAQAAQRKGESYASALKALATAQTGEEVDKARRRMRKALGA